MSAWKLMTGNSQEGTEGIIKSQKKGMVQLNLYREEWKSYSTKISTLFEGGGLK